VGNHLSASQISRQSRKENQMNDFLELMQEGDKLEASLGSKARRIAQFDEKLTKFIELIANKPGYRPAIHKALLQEAETTSDFPLLFGTVLERTLLAKYQIAKPDWRNYIASGTQNDFRIANAFQMYGLQSHLSVVKERGEYKADTMGEGKFAIQLQKYGRRFPISWEAMINDDLGAFSDAASRLADSALRTEFFQATALIASSTGPNATLFQSGGTHPIDGVTFTNKGTLTLNGGTAVDNLATTILEMKTQKDVAGEPIIITRFHLVVPAALEIAALKVLSNNLLIASSLGSTSADGVRTSENIIAKFPITLHVNPYLDIIDTTHGTTTWYVFADPQADGVAAKLNFLRGRENPEIVQKMSDKITLGGGAVSPLEGDFDSDSMQWRVRHILGGTQFDPRFAYAQAATS
jgi:hypothetical protein